MSDIHIDDFYRDTAKILLALYRNFPRPIILFVEDVSGPDTPDEFGLHSDRHQACFSAMIWLGTCGLVRYTDTIRQEALDQAVLTQKSFTLLSSRSNFSSAIPAIDASPENSDIPLSLAEELASNVNQLRKTMKHGSSAAIRQHMQHLLVESARF